MRDPVRLTTASLPTPSRDARRAASLGSLAASPVAVGFALFVHFLELLVAVVQAYIFTMLTATFIGMSAHPAH